MANTTHCTCGEPSPPVKGTLANGETVLIHPLVDRECDDAGVGGAMCIRPTVVLGGNELPFTTRMVGTSS